MIKETEIKLKASAVTIQQLMADAGLSQHLQQGWQVKPLLNLYFDTSDFALANAKVALRIRQDGDEYIQTLKTKGNSLAGLSERNEWDWDISNEQLKLELLTDSCWPDELQQLDKQQLQGIFRTDFTRHFGVYASAQQMQSKIEIALDQGQVKSDTGSEEIGEVELELLSGNGRDLLVLALELAQRFPLMPCDLSKAERGYRLLQADKYRLRLPANKLQAEQSLDSAVAQLVTELLASSQLLAEQYLHSANWKLLVSWITQLRNLRALLSSLGQVVPRQSSQHLRQALDELLEAWRPHLLATEQQQREQAHVAFVAEMQQCRWGVFSLQLALWLYDSQWQQSRSNKAQRVAALDVQRWLMKYLAQELLQLDLHNLLHKPQLMQDQQARIERMLVWLEYGRHLLTVTAADDLLGLLRKLLIELQQNAPDNQNITNLCGQILSSHASKELNKLNR